MRAQFYWWPLVGPNRDAEGVREKLESTLQNELESQQRQIMHRSWASRREDARASWGRRAIWEQPSFMTPRHRSATGQHVTAQRFGAIELPCRQSAGRLSRREPHRLGPDRFGHGANQLSCGERRTESGRSLGHGANQWPKITIEIGQRL
jgi:hypothetical protein